jgi:hypothetical protein
VEEAAYFSQSASPALVGGRLRDPRLAATLLDSSLQLEFIKPLSARYDGHHEMVDFGLSSTDRQAPPGKGRADDQPQNADFEH